MAELAGHPHVVRFVALFRLPRWGAHALVMERLSGGELYERVVARGPLPEDEVACVMHQVLDALRCGRLATRRLARVSEIFFASSLE